MWELNELVQTLSILKKKRELNESNFYKSWLSFNARTSNCIKSQFLRVRNSKMLPALFMVRLPAFSAELVIVCVPVAVKQAAIYLAKCRFKLKIFWLLYESSLDIAVGKDKWLGVLPIRTDWDKLSGCILFRGTKEDWSFN